MAKKKVPETYTGVYWPLGTKVKILKPHLWSDQIGEVVAVDERRGVHRIKTTGKTSFFQFHTEVTGDLLKPI